jgi:hypothetical protein
MFFLIAQGFCLTIGDQVGRGWSRKFCPFREIELETGGGPVVITVILATIKVNGYNRIFTTFQIIVVSPYTID